MTEPTSGDVPVKVAHPQIDLAHRLALAADAELRANAAMFLVILDGAAPGDELIWAGFGRLARMATTGTGDRRLGARLLASARRVAPPPWLSEEVRRLEETGR